MANQTKEIQSALRLMVADAVKQNAVNPDDVIAYLIDNGWKYALPSRPTLIDLLRKNKVEYIKGYWVKL